jgi:hypothetical protein
MIRRLDPQSEWDRRYTAHVARQSKAKVPKERPPKKKVGRPPKNKDTRLPEENRASGTRLSESIGAIVLRMLG